MKRKGFDWRDNQSIPGDQFDWSEYESGYTGGGSLVVNKKVKTKDPKEKVYYHGADAQEKYDMYYSASGNHMAPTVSKDVARGKLYEITRIRPVSDHEISVDTGVGYSDIIDLNKEKQYLTALGCATIQEFYDHVQDPVWREQFLSEGIVAETVDHSRLSLWDGHLASLRSEFHAQIKDKNAKPVAYYATIKGINGGGYIVDCQGITCFLPGSHAAAGIITNFEEMLGKTIPVMIINYDARSGFIVSYKKYLSYILPAKVAAELSVGMHISVKVTGLSRNGIFVQFKDKEGEWVYTGLVHRSVMSDMFEEMFNLKQFRVGDEFYAYIHSITDSDKGIRIVLGDKEPEIPETSDTKNVE